MPEYKLLAYLLSFVFFQTASSQGQAILQPAFPQPPAPGPAFPQPPAPAFPQPPVPQPGSGDSDSTYDEVDVPTCPKKDGKVYVAPDGSWFLLQCDYHGWFAPATHIEAVSYHDCLVKCSQVEDCSAIVWNNANGRTCSLMGAAAAKPGDTPCGNHDYAYMIDPPTTDQSDDAIFLCSTECPWANNQQFPTVYGRIFKMNCEMRHGTHYITSVSKDTLKECINACAALLSCRSVDYHERARKCYFSNHQGEPTIPAPGFSSAYNLGCAGGCNGGGCCGSTVNDAPEVPYCPTRPGRIFEAGGIRFQILDRKSARHNVQATLLVRVRTGSL
ncbi:hypothetical protein BDV12DRAFT_205282 [Aspergillus spectabilis]